MSYVLHYAPDNASMIIRLALDHAGIAFETCLVDRAKQAQQSAAYRRLNPAGLIPVLETPAGPIFETGAILLWLSETHAGLGPQPGDAARADYLKWMFFTSNTLHPALRMVFYPEKYIAAEQTCALRAGLVPQIQTALRTLDACIPNADWRAAGSGLGFYLACCLRWCALYPRGFDRSWFDLASTPHLAALCADLETLPATAKLQTAEGLGPTPFTAPRHAKPPIGSAT